MVIIIWKSVQISYNNNKQHVNTHTNRTPIDWITAKAYEHLWNIFSPIYIVSLLFVYFTSFYIKRVHTTFSCPINIFYFLCVAHQNARKTKFLNTTATITRNTLIDFLFYLMYDISFVSFCLFSSFLQKKKFSFFFLNIYTMRKKTQKSFCLFVFVSFL